MLCFAIHLIAFQVYLWGFNTKVMIFVNNIKKTLNDCGAKKLTYSYLKM